MLNDLALTALDGSPFATDLTGKVVLFVNVASRCGLTPQYNGLQALAEEKRDDGLVIVGVPCNQFGAQEPGSADEIATFCSVTYGVDFPLLEKQDVNGAGRSPLYQWLVGSEAGGGKDIEWNFGKFLVGKDGAVLERFAPTVPPEDPSLRSAIDAALAS
ncbi:MAG: glutathione peroxidase [Deltaproteobacteria bacterium]|nr:MAG: glutathione peroxidase [Deltaproteobacteria bacterium]